MDKEEQCNCPICRGVGLVMKPTPVTELPAIIQETLEIYDKTGRIDDTLALTALKENGLIPEEADLSELSLQRGRGEMDGLVRVLNIREIMKADPTYVISQVLKQLAGVMRPDMMRDMVGMDGMRDMTPDVKPNHLTLLH